MTRKYLLVLAYTVLSVTCAQAQQFEKFGPYELHYAVVNTTFLDPSVAATYGITRGEKRAIINLSVLDTGADGSPARTMLLKGRTWDLIQNQFLSFEEIHEGDAIYYIAEFKFINEEWRFFEIDFRPDNSDETFTFKLKHQLYIN